MVIKILLISLVLFIFILGYIFFIATIYGSEEDIKLYQGPVPKGYDEHHFRLTGETIPLEELNGK